MTIPVSRFSDLSDFFLASSRPEISAIELDLTNCSFIDPRTLTCLAQLIIKCKREGKTLTILPSRFHAVDDYVKSIGLQNFIRNNWEQPNEFLPAERNSALGLWSVSQEHKEYFTREFRDYFDSLDGSKDFTAVQTYFHELISNVYDHAESPTGAYTFGQFYPHRQNPSKRNLVLVVADLGIGISLKVNQFLSDNQQPLLNPSEAVLTAFKPRFSTESQPNNRGAGLDTIKSLVASLRGTLSVYTTGAVVEFGPINPEGVQHHPIQHLYGTTIVVDIPVANLNVRESISNPFSFT